MSDSHPITDIVIAAAARTPVGAFNGSLATLEATDLGAIVIAEVLKRAGVGAGEVDEVILGQVLTAGKGQNPARQAAMAAGLAPQVPAFGVNQVCGSGLKAVVLGALEIMAGSAAIVIAGGQESMSRAPHCAYLRDGRELDDNDLTDTMIKDGLWDAFNGYHMGVTAENVAKRFDIPRIRQDAFAAASQAKAEAAQKAGRFADEMVPVKLGAGAGVLERDEHPRPGTTIEALAGLKPAFAEHGSVTAGNASGLNDGAAAVVLMTSDEAAARGIQPLARLRSWAQAGVDPALMGTGPIPASKAALANAGWGVDDLDLVEANEAFAAQAMAVNQELGWDADLVNVNGGAIALGHPIGASGARILVTLLHEMLKRDSKRALATLCIGGGMGIAVTVERD
ncbi:MAG: acetyl-CoA C-acetyltransferase [Alphaproteobacteria bacterium]